MNEIYYLIIGWLMGILTMLINKWLDSFKERKKHENKILSECLIFIFAARDMYNEMAICLASLHEMGEKYPEKRNQLEIDLYNEAESVKEKQFFPKLMLQSFQLQTLQDETFYPLFEKIMSEYQILHESIVSHKTMEEVDIINKKILELTKKFIEKSKAKIEKRI
ncbi:hypothetical protein [Desulfogranum marinum]|uniref:hypothetical protein n=1 Tax=Desulfogranum marinum TaxID=453220 RepID=UPI001962318D|nr:hypothetical protein [Desulfogranum marinum]MBM9512018.1 hypothetical protein [Desulfogranum marinum]